MTLTIVAALEELERVLVGKDPFAVDAIVGQLHRDSYWRTGAVFRTALVRTFAAVTGRGHEEVLSAQSGSPG